MAVLRFPKQERQFDLPPAEVLFGTTERMSAVRRKLESVAKTQIPVLVQGESGTGKALCVQYMHTLADRPVSSLVSVSCPAIPHALLETELFGYEKGAFTGADSVKRGRVEQADGGTLLLDEVGSLDLGMQSKLLQVLQDGTYLRVGGHDTRRVKLQLVSVANRDLREQVEQGTFRLDFLYRINAITIDLPPLRERLADLPDLIAYFMQQHARTFQTRPVPFSRAVLRQMQKYDWPGNIRQLDNLIRSYIVLGSEDALMAELIPEGMQPNVLTNVDVSQPISLKQVTKQATLELERQIILKVLRANGWNRQKTAKWLRISYRSLLYKLNELGSVDAPKVRRTLVPRPPAAPGFGPSTHLL